MGVTVAVTGPTGQVGLAVVGSLEQDADVDRILAMARRPFDPRGHGWTKTSYRQGDIRDRIAVEGLVADADVVVHLAFLIMGSRDATRQTNLAGARNVFEATVAASRPRRLVYTSSVAAYGYYPGNPTPLTEDVPARGSRTHYYSQQKAECEALLREVTSRSRLEVYVLRPCIVAGPGATVLADSMPWNRVGTALSGAVRAVGRRAPVLRPVFPDPGVPVQLVHQDDLAAAVTAAASGRGSPGAYNIAGDGEVSLTDVANAVGGRGVRVPRALALVASTTVARLPRAPAMVEWVHAGTTSMVMDTGKARRELGWQPTYTSAEALQVMASGR